MAHKTSLTPEEAIKVAYLKHIMGIEQHVLSVVFSVNQGRIAEACVALEYTARNVLLIYKQAKGEEEENG